MATQTDVYGLTKPSKADYYDVGVFNDNADIIDETLNDIQSDLTKVSADLTDISESVSTLSSALDSKVNVSDFNVSGYAGIEEIVADVAASVNGMSVSGTEITYTKNDGTSGSINTQDTTYDVATSDADGLMSARDKAQFDTNIPRVEEIHDAIVAQGYTDGANDGGTEGVKLFFADIVSKLSDLTSRVKALESGTSTASLEYGLSVSSEEPETGNWGEIE